MPTRAATNADISLLHPGCRRQPPHLRHRWLSKGDPTAAHARDGSITTHRFLTKGREGHSCRPGSTTTDRSQEAPPRPRRQPTKPAAGGEGKPADRSGLSEEKTGTKEITAAAQAMPPQLSTPGARNGTTARSSAEAWQRDGGKGERPNRPVALGKTTEQHRALSSIATPAHHRTTAIAAMLLPPRHHSCPRGTPAGSTTTALAPGRLRPPLSHLLHLSPTRRHPLGQRAPPSLLSHQVAGCGPLPLSRKPPCSRGSASSLRQPPLHPPRGCGRSHTIPLHTSFLRKPASFTFTSTSLSPSGSPSFTWSSSTSFAALPALSGARGSAPHPSLRKPPSPTLELACGLAPTKTWPSSRTPGAPRRRPARHPHQKARLACGLAPCNRHSLPDPRGSRPPPYLLLQIRGCGRSCFHTRRSLLVVSSRVPAATYHPAPSWNFPRLLLSLLQARHLSLLISFLTILPLCRRPFGGALAPLSSISTSLAPASAHFSLPGAFCGSSCSFPAPYFLFFIFLACSRHLGRRICVLSGDLPVCTIRGLRCGGISCADLCLVHPSRVPAVGSRCILDGFLD